MKKLLAVLIVAAAAASAVAGTTEATTSPSAADCTPIKVVFAEKNWRDSKPARGVNVCHARDAKQRAGVKRTVSHFYEYRAYRKIATMKCLPGSEGWFVPNPGSCTVLACETGHDHITWWARNPSSGAEWVYQLLGRHTYPSDGYVRSLRGRVVSGGPRPSSFHNRLINHEIAGTLSRSAWAC